MMPILNLLMSMFTSPAWKIYVLKNNRNTTITAKIIQTSCILKYNTTLLIGIL